MTWEKKRLDEEKAQDKRIIFSISLNQREQVLLNNLMMAYGIEDKSKVLKKAAFFVAQTPFLIETIGAIKKAILEK